MQPPFGALVKCTVIGLQGGTWGPAYRYHLNAKRPVFTGPFDFFDSATEEIIMNNKGVLITSFPFQALQRYTFLHLWYRKPINNYENLMLIKPSKRSKAQDPADISPFSIILRSFYRRILHSLWQDVEAGVISPKLLYDISHDLKKAAAL